MDDLPADEAHLAGLLLKLQYGQESTWKELAGTCPRQPVKGWEDFAVPAGALDVYAGRLFLKFKQANGLKGPAFFNRLKEYGINMAENTCYTAMRKAKKANAH